MFDFSFTPAVAKARDDSVRDPVDASGPFSPTLLYDDPYALFDDEHIVADEASQIGQPVTPCHDAETIPGDIEADQVDETQDDQVAETNVQSDDAVEKNNAQADQVEETIVNKASLSWEEHCVLSPSVCLQGTGIPTKSQIPYKPLVKATVAAPSHQEPDSVPETQLAKPVATPCRSSEDETPSVIPDLNDSTVARPTAGVIRLSTDAIDARLRRVFRPNFKGEYKVGPEILKKWQCKKQRKCLERLFQSCGYSPDRGLKQILVSSLLHSNTLDGSIAFR